MRNELQQAAKSYSNCLHELGVKQGELIQIYDFGSSPISFLFGRNYCPLSIEGTSELLNVRVLFNDGIPDFLGRGLYGLAKCRPNSLIIRKELLGPLVQRNKQYDEIKNGGPTRIIVTADRDFITKEELLELQEKLRVEISYIFRIDEILFFAYSCTRGKLHYHYPKKQFRIDQSANLWNFHSYISEKTITVSGNFRFEAACSRDNDECGSLTLR